MESNKDCFSCSNSMLNDDDELVCVLDGEIVPDAGYCDEFN